MKDIVSIAEEMRKLMEHVSPLLDYDTGKLYGKLKRTVEKWMEEAKLYGKLTIPIEGGRYKVVFNFSAKTFEVMEGLEAMDPFFSYVNRTFTPFWLRDYVRVLMFLKNFGYIVDKLKEEFGEMQDMTAKLLKLAQELNVVEVETKLLAEEVSKKLKE